jgi:hypothetical protein
MTARSFVMGGLDPAIQLFCLTFMKEAATKPARFGLRTSGKKSALPKGVCYPLQLNDLAVFEAVPDERFPALYFTNSLGMGCPRRNVLRVVLLPYVVQGSEPQIVFDASYRANGPMISNARTAERSSEIESRWSIFVYPVQGSNRAVMREKLKSGFVSTAADWMMRERTEVWLRSNHRLRFRFDPADQSLRIEE